MTYYEFELDLTWHGKEKGISVFYKDKEWQCSSGEPNVYDENLIRPEDTNDIVDFAHLYCSGKKIAALLFPTVPLREEFRALWRMHGAIRLRLIYPNDDTSIFELSKVLWEYAYLNKYGEDEPKKPEFLLGLNHEISIVHSLNQTEQAYTQMSIEKLPAMMNYFSFLNNEADDNEILKQFSGQYRKLTSIINCSNLIDLEEPYLKNNPAVQPKIQRDILMAMAKNHFIHLTGHCTSGTISLAGGTGEHTINLSELRSTFSQYSEIDLKAIILLCCGSGSATQVGDVSKSLAVTLHELGVPVVIGMSRTIHTEPARHFVDGFYRALADWPIHGLERAIVDARHSIFNKVKNEYKWSLSYGLPRLFLNGSNSILISEELLFSTSNMKEDFDKHIEYLLETAKPEDEISTASPIEPDDPQKKLELWLEQPSSRRWYLVTGKSGSGKSTRIAKLINNHNSRETKLIYHFCLDRSTEPDVRLETRDPLAFVLHSLVPQLTDCFNDEYVENKKFKKEDIERFGKNYRDWFPEGRYPLLTHNVDEALVNFVIEPLQKLRLMNQALDNPDPMPVFIIDGIDAILPDHSSENSIVGLLLRHRDIIDNVGSFLITAGWPDKVEDEEIRRANIDENIEVFQDILRLTYYENENDPDIIELNDDRYAHYLIEETKRRFSRFSWLDQSRIEKISGETWNDLDKLFEDTIKILHYKDSNLSNLLHVIALAYQPLSLDEVVHILDVENNEEMNDWLESNILGPFFDFFKFEDEAKDKPGNGNLKPNKLVLFHTRFRRHLQRRKILWWTGLKARIHEKFVKTFHPKNDKWASGVSDYSQHYLIHHAYQAYKATPWHYKNLRPQRANEFLNLACDPDFRKFRKDLGEEVALQDIKKALRVVFTEYVHGLPKPDPNNNKAVAALNSLLAIEYHRGKLIDLEMKLESGDGDVSLLKGYLGLKKENILGSGYNW